MNRLKELCEEFNMSTYDFKDKLGYSKDIISNISRGASSVDADKLIKLSDFFQVSYEYFLMQSNEGIYVDVLGKRYSLSKDKFLLYKSAGKIIYNNGIRTLAIKDINEIEIVEGNAQLIKLKNEIL